MENKTPVAINESVARILVVDDHPNTATTLARAISQLGVGVEVLSATSGKEAIEYANNGAFDVLITDMMMPGINGLELIEHLQSHPGGRPTHNILITAYDVPGLKESARRLKVNEVIIKPVRPEQIYQIVHNILEGMGRTKIPVPATPSVHQPFKILIADDMPDNITLLSRYMQSEGYNFVTAVNGVEALQKTRLEMPDLILLDINMPQKDGFAVLEELRADPEFQYIPVIVLTAARLTSSDIQSGLNLGADDYVTKPFDKRELFARIRTKLRVKEAEDAIRRRNRELSVLPEIAKELSARLDLDELILVVLRRTVETLGAFVGHMIIFDPIEPVKKTYRISNASEPKTVRFPDLEGCIQEIEESRQSKIINDVRNDTGWHADASDPTRSAVIVPMFGREKLLGLLILGHEKSDYFEMEHLVLIQAIASQATIAVENARLYAYTVQEQRRLNAVLQSAADAILMFDEHTHLLLSNPAGQKLFPDFDTKLGQPLAEGSGYDDFVQLLKQAQRVGEFTAGEVVWPDQRTFSVLITHIQEGGYVALLHDVSNFIKLEEVKNKFIATASHDLKNPLTIITGFIQMLPKAGPLNEKQSEFVERIGVATENMNTLVQNMLELAKIDLEMELKHEPVDICGLLGKLESEFEPQAAAKRQTLRFAKPDGLTVVQGDPFQLHQALSNLVGNAIKYTPDQGAITLSAELEPGQVTISVRDTGYGIPKADLPFIFDRFYRVQDDEHPGIDGTGLGLAIVKSIAEQHAGKVAVESEPGKGTCFRFTVPLDRRETALEPVGRKSEKTGASAKPKLAKESEK
jgi:signal transduction histidine kinase/DNA-binding response OmpR family regulator